MSNQPQYSSQSLPHAAPIFIAAGSPEEYLLDPRYYRIVGALPQKSTIRSAMPSISTPKEQFSENFITKEKATEIVPQLTALSLDDISIFSGPTSYMEGSNKKYEITFKINNPQKLKIKDVEYRIAEVN